MTFEVDNKPAFEIPLKDVSSATTGEFLIFYVTGGGKIYLYGEGEDLAYFTKLQWGGGVHL